MDFQIKPGLPRGFSEPQKGSTIPPTLVLCARPVSPPEGTHTVTRTRLKCTFFFSLKRKKYWHEEQIK